MTLDVRRRRDRVKCFERCVFLNGVEVTRRCIKFDVRRGYVLLYKLTPEGRMFAIGGRAVTEHRRGRVVVKPLAFVLIRG